MISDATIKFDFYVSPATYAKQIKEANAETNTELKNQKMERIQQSIDENNVKIATSIETLNKEILKSKQFAERTVASYQNINLERNGSAQIINDYKTIYELSYVRNFALLLGMFGLASFTYNNWN